MTGARLDHGTGVFDLQRTARGRHLKWFARSACASDIFMDIQKRSDRILMSRDTGSTLTS